MFGITEKSWHRDVAAQAAAPVDRIRGLDSSCSSVMGGTTAPRGLNTAAPAPSVQLTS